MADRRSPEAKARYEPNAVPGALNAAASLVADLVLLGQGEAGVGYPLRPEYLRRSEHRHQVAARFGLPAEARIVLVVGGSQGSARLNTAVATALPRLAAVDELTLMHVAGLSPPCTVARSMW